MGSIYVLLAHYAASDTHDVVCHWHDEPSDDDIQELISMYVDKGECSFELALVVKSGIKRAEN